MHLIFTRFIPAILYFAGLTVLLLLPGKTFQVGDQSWVQDYQLDKVVHLLLFGILVFLFCRPIQLKGHFTKAISFVYILIFIIAIVYGFIIELIQKTIPGRDFDWWDLLADAIGAYIGYRMAKNILKKQKPATMDELKQEAVDYAKKYVGDKLGKYEKFIPTDKDKK